MKIKNLIIIILGFLLLYGCAKKRPEMAYELKNKGAKQDIEAFGAESSAENFRKTSGEFNKTALKVLSKNKDSEVPTSRRISLKNTDTKKAKLSIIDHNMPIKKLDNALVSFQFNNIEIRSALKLFASTIKRNIIIGNEVQGKITMDFENIKWGGALYAVLDINNLVMTADKDSGLLRVHTAEQFAILNKSKIDQTLEINKNLATLETGMTSANSDGTETTISEIFKIYFQTSTDIITPLSAIISETTVITDDPANNQLIVTGTLSELEKIDLTLQEIDIEKKQVMIEAYIISASAGFTKNFSANLQLASATQARDTGKAITYTGIDTNPSGTARSFAGIQNSTGLDNTKQPDSAASAAKLAGGAFLLGNIGITKLKAVITSSIDDKNSETISNPKLFASDGKTSTLVQGVTLLRVIPAAGEAAGSTEEIAQNLNITVTPRIIGENKIKMELSIQNNSPGATDATTTVTNTESITSTIQLNTGDVAILGGVYKNSKVDNKNYVPFLSSIPILGHFFKQKIQSDGKTQLLIFLTAKVV